VAHFRDAHIEPDWLLIYKIDGDVVCFERTGRHTDLFDEWRLLCTCLPTAPGKAIWVTTVING
jgi:hypothetical protein